MDEPRERWHAFIADPERSDGMAIDGREVGVFCPDCTRQEFGEGARYEAEKLVRPAAG